MLEKILTVQYLNVKNNFCYLNHHLLKELGPNANVMISYSQGREFFFTVSPQVQNIEEDSIGINSLYAKLLKIEEHSTVVLSSVGHLPRVTSFTIHPIRFDDFHVLDLLKTEVENCVLNQTSIVGNDQELLIWIGENLNIPIRVVKVEPVSPGKLDNLTELIILPQTKQTKILDTEVTEIADTKNAEENKEVSKMTNGKKLLETLISNIFDPPPELTDEEKEIANKLRRYSNMKENYNGRLVPWIHLELCQNSICSYEFNVLLHKKSAPFTWRNSEEPNYCLLRLVNNSDSRELYVRVFLIEEMPKDVILINNIFVHENLLKILKCDIGRGVVLKPVHTKEISEEIEVYTKNDRREVKNKLQEYLANKCTNFEFVLNADYPIKLENDILCSLKFKPNYAKYCCVDQEFLRNCRYSFMDDHVQALPSGETTKKIDYIETSIDSSICEKILQYMRNNLGQTKRLGCFLITGKVGTGKSKVVEKLKHSLCGPPCFIYSEVFECKSSKGKTIDSLHKILITILENLIAHEPAILFIEDLQIICKNGEDNDAQPQNTVYYDRISEMIYTLLMAVVKNYSVGIIATAESSRAVNKNIHDSRGTYLFDELYNIDELTKDDRLKIMKNLLKDYDCEIDFAVLSRKTEGYVFQDLCDLIKKVIFQSVKADSNKIQEEHVEKAFSQMEMLSNDKLKLHSPGNKDFSNVGGMENVKQILEEILMWPLMYPNIFKNAPIRLQSGVLLYGPPGTGKTLIAGAAAKQFGIRLISIKGPELLSKYIGASEEAVRDVFVRAQSAKPCILFFDEFDSLAPRRGHDSTGVTDRVVNQFLTQMDGVESLTGVCILAATSRPDLLDPALLRPGRLDKKVYCPLPDKKTRLDILTVLSKEMKFSEDVNLEEIAECTENYSGADLQSIIYNAYSSTIEHLLVQPEDTKEMEQPEPITQKILKSSLDKTRPSLSAEDQKKYNLIYSKFQQKPVMTDMKPGTKASLA